MKLTDADLAQAEAFDRVQFARADELLRLSFQPTARARWGTPLAVQTEGKHRSIRCPKCGRFDDWAPKRTQGKGRNKRILDELAYVCRGCGTMRPAEEAVDYQVRNAQRGGWDPSRQEQFIYLNPTRIVAGSNEERIFGRAELGERWRLRRLRTQFEKSARTKWPARAYVRFVMQFDARMGSGGISGLLRLAKAHWDYPLPWTRHEVQRLVDSGRFEWCKRLETAEML